jgi:hypothetical protein
MSFKEFGDRKAEEEGKATTKQAQLLFDLLDHGGELATAAKRNLITAGGFVLEHAAKGKVPRSGSGGVATGEASTSTAANHSVNPADLKELQELRAELLKSRTEKPSGNEEADKKRAKSLEDKMDQFLKKHMDVLRDGLPRIDTDPDLGKAVLDNFKATRHNVIKGDPTDSRNLKTAELYAFDQMRAPTNLGKIIGAAAKDYAKEPFFADVVKWMEKSQHELSLIIDKDDEKKGLDTDVARHKVVLDAIELLKAEYPSLGDTLKDTFGFSPDMEELAKARFQKLKESKSEKFQKVVDENPRPQAQSVPLAQQVRRECFDVSVNASLAISKARTELGAVSTTPLPFLEELTKCLTAATKILTNFKAELDKARLRDANAVKQLLPRLADQLEELVTTFQATFKDTPQAALLAPFTKASNQARKLSA